MIELSIFMKIWFNWNYLKSCGFLKKRLNLGHSEAVQDCPGNWKNKRQEWKTHCNWLEEEHFGPVAGADKWLQVHKAQQPHQYNKYLRPKWTWNWRKVNYCIADLPKTMEWKTFQTWYSSTDFSACCGMTPASEGQILKPDSGLQGRASLA